MPETAGLLFGGDFDVDGAGSDIDGDEVAFATNQASSRALTTSSGKGPFSRYTRFVFNCFKLLTPIKMPSFPSVTFNAE